MQLNGLFSFLGKSFMSEGEEAVKSADGSGQADRFGAALAAAFGLRTPHGSNQSGKDPDAADSTSAVVADSKESPTEKEGDGSSSMAGTLAATNADAAAPTDPERARSADPSVLTDEGSAHKDEGSASSDDAGADHVTTPNAAGRSSDLPNGAQIATQHQSQNQYPSSKDADRPSVPSNPGERIAAGQDGNNTDEAKLHPVPNAGASEALPGAQGAGASEALPGAQGAGASEALPGAQGAGASEALPGAQGAGASEALPGAQGAGVVHGNEPASGSPPPTAASPSSKHTGDPTDGSRTTGNVQSDSTMVGDQPAANIDLDGTENAANAKTAGDEQADPPEPSSRGAEILRATTSSARVDQSPQREGTPAGQQMEPTLDAHQAERTQSTRPAGSDGATGRTPAERLDIRIPEGKSNASPSSQDEVADDASRTVRVSLPNGDPKASSPSPATARETAAAASSTSANGEAAGPKQSAPVRAAETAAQNVSELGTDADPDVAPTTLVTDGTDGDAADAALKNADSTSRSSSTRDADSAERKESAAKTSPSAQGDRAFSQGQSDMSSDSDNPTFSDPRKRTTLSDVLSSDFEASIEDISVEEIPVDAELPPDDASFSPEQKTTLSALSAMETTRGSSRPQAPGSMAWLRTILGQSTKALELAQGWKAIEVQLEKGMGTMTVRARRGDDGVTVSVSFSDPTLRSLAENNIHRLQDALRAEYEANVDLSLMSDGSEDTPSQDDRTDRGRSSQIGGASASMREAESASESSSVSRPNLAGVRNEWIG